jgi:hypothetical protein
LQRHQKQRDRANQPANKFHAATSGFFSTVR